QLERRLPVASHLAGHMQDCRVCRKCSPQPQAAQKGRAAHLETHLTPQAATVARRLPLDYQEVAFLEQPGRLKLERSLILLGAAQGDPIEADVGAVLNAGEG